MSWPRHVVTRRGAARGVAASGPRGLVVDLFNKSLPCRERGRGGRTRRGPRLLCRALGRPPPPDGVNPFFDGRRHRRGARGAPAPPAIGLCGLHRRGTRARQPSGGPSGRVHRAPRGRAEGGFGAARSGRGRPVWFCGRASPRGEVVRPLENLFGEIFLVRLQVSRHLAPASTAGAPRLRRGLPAALRAGPAIGFGSSLSPRGSPRGSAKPAKQ